MAHRSVQLIVMTLAAALEVGGDALIRRGLLGTRAWLVAVGFVTLGSYGLLVNQLALDFSVLLGAYVGVFAAISILFGAALFGERIAVSTWIGLAVVLAGSAIMYLGRR